MAYPIIEQIAQAIKTQLESITVVGGYEIDVTEVLRPRRTGILAAPKNHEIVMLQLDPTRASEYDVTGNPAGIGWRQSFALDLCLRPSDAADTPIDQLINTFVADVTRAMMADVHWGGLAIDTLVDAPQYMQSADGTYEGATVQFDVIYRVAENNPYTQV